MVGVRSMVFMDIISSPAIKCESLLVEFPSLPEAITKYWPTKSRVYAQRPTSIRSGLHLLIVNFTILLTNGKKWGRKKMGSDSERPHPLLREVLDNVVHEDSLVGEHPFSASVTKQVAACAVECDHVPVVVEHWRTAGT